MGGRDLGTGVPELYRCASLEVEDEKEHRCSPPSSSGQGHRARARPKHAAACAASAHPARGGPPRRLVPGAPSSRWQGMERIRRSHAGDETLAKNMC